MTDASTRERSAPIIVVSGLPRSGTSMMMQMLAAAGCPVLVDAHRPADESNSQGYFEFLPVKAIRRDASFLADASGCAVKIVAPLLEALPAQFDYCVVLMRRDVEAVLRSQARMLRRLGEVDGRSDEVLGPAFSNVMDSAREWLSQSDRVAWIEVDYDAACADPRETAARVAGFLESHAPGILAGGADSQARMAARVRKALPVAAENLAG